MAVRPFLLILCVSATALASTGSTPIVINYSDAAQPGDTIYLQGSDFGSSPFVEYAYNDAIWSTARVITSINGIVTLKIPGTETRLPDLLTVRISADNSHWSAPVYVNKAIPLSFDTDAISPNSTFRLFGRNLFLGRTPTVRFVDSADGNSQYAAVNTSSSTHYLLNVTAPAAIQASHTYKIFVSNSLTGNSSSAVETLAPETITGRIGGADHWQIGRPWAADLDFFANIYNVQTDVRLGTNWAAGNGTTDDTWAIVHAAQVAAAAGGGVVYLPAGTYKLLFSNGCGIQLPPRVVLQGAGASDTSINYGYPMGTLGGYAVCFSNQTGMADITLNNVDVAQQWQWSSLSINNSEVFLKGVNWIIGTSQWLNFVNDDHVAIEDSNLYQQTDSAFSYLGPLNMASCAHCEVSGTTIHFTVCGILFDGASDLVFENNQVLRDISVAPNPASVTHSIAANFVKNFTVLKNLFQSNGTALPTNNDGEVINTEAGGNRRFDEFRGTISAITATTLTDNTQNFFQSPNTVPALRPLLSTVAIVSGNGLGQTRTVTSVSADGQSIVVDHPWDIQPDVSSHYATFDWSAENWTIAENSMVGNFKGLEIFDASANNLLIEKNTLIDSDGIMVSPSEAVQGASGARFNVVTDLKIEGNTFTDQLGLRPAYVGLIPREDLQTSSFGTHLIGTAVRSNNVTAFIPNVVISNPSWDDYKVKTEGFLCDYYWQSLGGYDLTAPPPLLGSIFQGNVARNGTSAFYLNSGCSGTAIGDNVTWAASALTEDVPLLAASTGSIGTVIQDSLSTIPVGLSGPGNDLLEANISSIGARAFSLGHSGSPSYSLQESGDQLMLLGQTISTNESVVAHVLLNIDAATGLIMIRNTSDPLSPFVSIGLKSGQIVITSRMLRAGPIQTTPEPFTASSAWLQLKKAGGVVVAMYSTDGIKWSQVPNTVVFSGSEYLAGVADLSNGENSVIETTFDSVSFTLLTMTRSAGVIPSPSVPVAQTGARGNQGLRLVRAGIERVGHVVSVAFKSVKSVFRAMWSIIAS